MLFDLGHTKKAIHCSVELKNPQHNLIVLLRKKNAELEFPLDFS